MTTTKSALCLFFLLAQATCIAGNNDNFQPVELISENGRLDVTLTVDLLESFNGTKIGPAYNGAPVGPTLRVKPGDTLAVTLENKLPPPTDLDRELYGYIQDPVSEEEDELNVTIIYNRLDEAGNIHNPTFGFWGLNYMNLHFHG
jgi:FtsP/CotA-like multicopper oxidase with cupredoxin domain